jgi:hypothetical protein
MKFAITQFTFDPKNFVNISEPVKNDLETRVNKILKQLQIGSKYTNWEFVYVISSHEDYSKKLTILKKPMKSHKNKTLTFYIYFPRLRRTTKYGEYGYNLEKFIEFFFESLDKLLLSFFEIKQIDSTIIAENFKKKWINNPKAIYDEDEILLTPAEIRKILREK